ncbi:MAG: hypothetical protein DMF64_17735 [Acidobacteria bacterium]|nr:MAG: hypothetical protein DMF64_17735 [Acidobacteriota bacterium]
MSDAARSRSGWAESATKGKRLLQRRERRLSALLIVICFCTCIASVLAQQPTGTPYQPGEKLTYTVTFSSFAPAAHVELFVAGRGTYFNREGVELRAHVATVEAVRAALLSINNDYVAYVDPRTGQPFHTQVSKHNPEPPPSITSGSFSTDADVINAGTTTENNAPTTFDFLSALYYLRTQTLAPGSIYPLTAQQQDKQYQAELRVTGRETVKTPAGSFNALVTQLRVRDNSAANDYRVRIYFSDDARHIPVLVTARQRVGEIRAELASVDIVDLTPPAEIAAQATPTPRPTPRPTPTPREHSADPTQITGLPFQVGEPLGFKFYLGAGTQPIGVANFQVRQRGRFFNRDGILLSATLSTAGEGQRLFPVNDRISAYVDATSLLPYRTELQVQEGRHQTSGVVTIDQERGSAIVTDGKSIEVPVGTYDWVSVLYALRSFDLTPPKRNAVSLLINRRPRTLFISSVKRETIELGGQRIPAIQLEISTDDPQGNQMNLHLWVSADKRHLPLRVTATTPIGQVRADLSIIQLTQQ